jgi:hypothetical protein
MEETPAQRQARGAKEAREAREQKAFDLSKKTVQEDLAALPKGTVKRVVDANTPKKTGQARRRKHRKTRRRR